MFLVKEAFIAFSIISNQIAFLFLSEISTGFAIKNQSGILLIIYMILNITFSCISEAVTLLTGVKHTIKFWILIIRWLLK